LSPWRDIFFSSLEKRMWCNECVGTGIRGGYPPRS
jgi:hypothetical protein